MPSLMDIFDEGCRTKPPAQPHSSTSQAAGESIGAVSGSLRRAVYEFIRGCAELGATDEEIQEGLPMPSSTQRPRRVELVNAGMVYAAGERKTRSGRMATVWRVKQQERKP